MNTILLSNKVELPTLGLGLWKVTKTKDVGIAVKAALDTGYTHFDSAQIYGNEALLGDALQEAGMAREDVFVTTKIWNDNFWPGDLEESFEQSLKNLQTEYVGLLLLHFPVTETRRIAWTSLEKLYKDGKAKSIGVSNYTIKHLEEMKEWATVTPHVNQVELHVFLQQPELLAYCKQNSIVVEAYSPLAHGHGLDNSVLKEIAEKHGKTTAQVMIRWCLDSGTVPLPKSTNPERIVENADVFDFSLDAEDMEKLKTLDNNLRTCWDPTNTP
jgi:diketogulonate reductase-like aldo/keto reductase